MPRTLPRRAFTLMELLIVVAVIALLVGIVAVTLRGVRGAASRTNSLSALRQMAMGYSLYSQDNNGRLLPGYLSLALLNDPIHFDLLRISLGGGSELADEDKQSYVWRLAPYVDDSWQTFFEEADAGAMARFTAEYRRMADPNETHTPGLISELPSFGLNSIFVGGDAVHGGVENQNPWDGSLPAIAATRLSQVVNPTRLIVFAPAATAAASSDAVYDDIAVGFCEIRAPYVNLDLAADTWRTQQWFIGAGGLVTQAVMGTFGDPPGGGLPIARTAKDVLSGGMEPMPVVHLDGSTAVQPIVELSKDMRYWNPFEVGLRQVEPDS